MKTLPLLTKTESLARHDERNRIRPSPRTAYFFQTPADSVAIAPETRSSPSRVDLRAFRRLRDDYLSKEAGNSYLVEVLVYGLLTAIAAWPLISLINALAETARG